MKIGIVTFTYGDNFGQRLQNYAVQQILKERGHEVYTLRQKPPVIGLHSMLSKVKNIKKTLRFARRHRSFVNYDKKNIAYYPNTILQPKNIKADFSDEFDYFIAGSDQVWSPYSADVNSTMFLNFAPKQKSIALSPSIAADRIPTDKKNEYRKYLNNFAHLSVREFKGAELIKDITGKEAKVLLDPTLALHKKDWLIHMRAPKYKLPKKYILKYFLGDENKIKLTDELKEIEIVDVLNDKTYMNTSPDEFLYLIYNAEFVITDSYHGTIFSLLFHKKFFIFERVSGSVVMNSRFETLYKHFPIVNQLNNNIANVDKNKDIYRQFDTKLGILREEFEKYISDCGL